MKKPVRLQKYLAQCGVSSRRKAEELIAAGKVQIDGETVTEMGHILFPEKHTITVNGQPVETVIRHSYYLLNKPKGYVTTVADPQGRPVVTSLIKESVHIRLFPVGRLDLDTEGALLLTDDGELAQKIQHPSFHIDKTYEALVRGIPDKNKLSILERGFILEGKMTYPAKLSILSEKNRNCLVKITIHEGRKRQVKKMFSHIGHPVLALKRTAYGRLLLGSLPSGHYKALNPSDLKKIFM